MKKIIIFLLSIFLLTGCGKGLANITSPYDLMVPPQFLEHFDYEADEIPKFILEFDDSFNVIDGWKENELIFSNNDDFKVSALIKKILDENDYSVLVSETETMKTTKMNGIVGEKRKTQKLVVDDEIVYNEIVCVNLENGLKLTIQFRRFISEGRSYYAWQYRNSLRLVLHYPLMVIKKENVNKLILLTLPDGFSNYTVNFQLAIKGLIEKDRYLYGEYIYSFDYINVDITNQEDVDNAINKIKAYYINHFEGLEDENEFTFVYLGNNFSIDFSANSFTINYLENQ